MCHLRWLCYTMTFWASLSCTSSLRAESALPSGSTPIFRAKYWFEQGESYRRQETNSALSRSEREKVRWRRRDAFRQAAFALNEALAQPDQSPVQRLITRFTLGLSWERSGDPERAYYAYTRCAKDPDLNNPQATYNRRPLAREVQQGIQRVRPRVPPPNQPSVRWRVVHSGKAGIRDPQLVVSNSEASYSEQEAIQLLERCLPQGAEALALKIGKEVLQASKDPVLLVNASYLTVPGMALFGIDAEEALLQELADQLVAERQRLVARYFDVSGDAPVLYVYANLTPQSDEEVGERLSHAVHGRGYANTEGYFLSFDNSLVLRRGLRDGSADQPVRLFLGTAVHELAHALIHFEFPEVPWWLDEGLAASFEEQGPEGPVDNYRLYFLLEARRAGILPHLKALLTENTAEFRESRIFRSPDQSYLRGPSLSSGSHQLRYSRVRTWVLSLDDPLPPWVQRPHKDRPGEEASSNEAKEVPDEYLLYAAHARYFCLFLRERCPGEDQLQKIYWQLRALGPGATTAKCKATITTVTGVDLTTLQDEFNRFLQGRSIRSIEPKWGAFQPLARDYVGKLAASDTR